MTISISIKIFPLVLFLYHGFMAAKQWSDDLESGEQDWLLIPGTNFSCAYWQWHTCWALINLAFVLGVSLVHASSWEPS